MRLQIEKAEQFIKEILQSQISPALTYHNYFHTADVVSAAMALAKEEGITDENELLLLKTAALFHDSGFINVYDGHEAESCRLAEKTLPGFGYTDEQIRMICDIIMKTKVPTNPETNLQNILCDADLDYLGRDDFEKIGDRLYHELSGLKRINGRNEWDKMQVKFLQSHHYWTKSANAKREEKKAEHLKELKAKIG